jgi:hypothetical protein
MGGIVRGQLRVEKDSYYTGRSSSINHALGKMWETYLNTDVNTDD